MKKIRFDGQGSGDVDITSFDSGVPNSVQNMEIDFGGLQSNLASLTDMMSQTTRKLQITTIENVKRLSPEFLALFVLLSNKTSMLRLQKCCLSEALLGCLMGSIMNGLQGLEIQNPQGSRYTPSTYQTKLLFEAVASSTSLSQLFLQFSSLQLDDEVCTSLLRALRRNRQLRWLELDVSKISAPQQILRTVLWESELNILTMTSKKIKKVPISILIEGLCREECTLSELDFPLHFKIDVDLNDISIHNTSMAQLSLRFSNLTCDQVVKIAKLCKSLLTLNVTGTPISDLAPLDEILLGETATLQLLCLDNDGISEETWIEFFENTIPKMQSLEFLELSSEPFAEYSDSLKTALLDALWQNSSLEGLYIHDEDVMGMATVKLHEVFFSKVSIPLALNRAGRKALRQFGQPLPKGLWPLVLKRAMKLKYYSVVDSWRCPSVTSTRTDAVFWLLREHLLV